MAIEPTRDPRVLVIYGLCVAGLFAALLMHTIPWSHFLIGMTLLNVPGLAGLKQGEVSLPRVDMSDHPPSPDTPVTIIIPPQSAPPKERP